MIAFASDLTLLFSKEKSSLIPFVKSSEPSTLSRIRVYLSFTLGYLQFPLISDGHSIEYGISHDH